MMGDRQMVMMPRDLAQRLCKDYTGRPNWDALEGDRLAAVVELRDFLARSAELYQGEPVAWLYTRPDVGAIPVVIRERVSESDRGSWDEAPLYTHADAGEVERLRAELEKVKDNSKQLAELDDAFIKVQGEKLKAVTAQLTERDALLRGLVEYSDSLLSDCNRAWSRAGRCADDDVHEDADYLKAVQLLSASAGPSAPVHLCGTCKGYGKYQDGDSGTDEDGRCPNIVECECDDSERMPQHRAGTPVECEPLVSEDELRDMAASACQSALSHGFSEDWFVRLARTVEERARAALERKP